MRLGQTLMSVAALAMPAVAGAEQFAVMSDSKIQLYGFVRLDGTLDLKGSSADSGDWGGFLMTQPIDGSAAANRKGDTYITARTSRLGVKGKLGDGAVDFKLEGTSTARRPRQIDPVSWEPTRRAFASATPTWNMRASWSANRGRTSKTSRAFRKPSSGTCP